MDIWSIILGVSDNVYGFGKWVQPCSEGDDMAVRTFLQRMTWHAPIGGDLQKGVIPLPHREDTRPIAWQFWCILFRESSHLIQLLQMHCLLASQTLEINFIRCMKLV